MRRYLLSCLASLCTAAAVQAAPCGPLTVAMYEHGSLYYHNEAGWTGIDKDLLDELARRTGCVFQQRLESRVRIWTMLQDGTLDMAMSGIATPEREKFARFIPYMLTHNVLLLRNAVAAKAPTLEQFLAQPELKVAVIKSFRHGPGYDAFFDKLRAQGRVYETADYNSLLRLFRNGRVHAIVQLNNNVQVLQREDQLGRAFRVMDWAPQDTVQASLVLSRPNVPEHVMDMLGQALRAMREDGSLRSIIERHVGPERAAAMLLR